MIKKLILSIATVFTLPTSAFAQTAPDLQQVFKEVSPLFESTMMNCPEKIWPNYNWKSVHIFFIEAGKPTQVWNALMNTT